jgi:hypothetical protein
LVTSTSTTVVSCADTCSDSTIRAAMVWRNRLIFSVRPRAAPGTPLGSTWVVGASVVAGALGVDAAGATDEADAAAAAASARAAAARSAAASTSDLRMRPPTPVPAMVLRSTPCSLASLRTSGVT